MEKVVRVYNDPVFYIVIDNCFGRETSKAILQHIIFLSKHFKPAGVGKQHKIVKAYRTNLNCFIDSLYRGPDCILPNGKTDRRKLRAHRAKSVLLRAVDNMMESSEMKSLMESAPYPLCKFRDFNIWSTQVSRYGNNEYYTWHKDRLDDDRRTVTMVYYVYSYPKKFKGGQLLLTNGLIYAGKLISKGKIVKIEPKNDRMVIFGSRTIHSVKRTQAPDEFADGRFSVNIWAGRVNSFNVGNQW